MKSKDELPVNIKSPANVVSLMLVIILGVIYIALGIKDSYMWGMTADSAIYILMAESMFNTPVSGIDFAFLHENYPFPPLFSLLLAILGGGVDRPEWTYLVNLFVIAISLVILNHWYGRELSEYALAPTTLALLFALLPSTLGQVMVIQSEHLYLLLTISGILLVNKDRSDFSLILAAAVLFGFAMLARTIGLASVLALLACSVGYMPFRKIAIIAVAGLFPYAVWSFMASSGVPANTDYLDILVKAYAGPGLLDGISAQVSVNMDLLLLYWKAYFGILRFPLLEPLLYLFTVFILVGLAGRLVSRTIDGFYVVLYTVILVIWPYPGQLERFLYPLMPILLIYCVLGGVYLTKKWMRVNRYIPAIVVSGLFFLVLPMQLALAKQYFNHDSLVNSNQNKTFQWLTATNASHMTESMNYMNDMFSSSVEIGRIIPAGQCVYSMMPAYVMLYAGVKSHKTPPDWNQQGAEGNSLQCDYVLMVDAVPIPSNGLPAMYPFDQVKDRMEVLMVRYDERPGSDEYRVMSMLVRYTGLNRLAL